MVNIDDVVVKPSNCDKSIFTSQTRKAQYCQTSDLGLRLEVDFVFPLSQQEQEEQEPSPKFSQKGRY